MGRILTYGLGGLALLLVIALAIPVFLPAEAYKGRIERMVSEATGREFKIAGDIDVSFLPPVTVSASEVSLSNEPGLAPANMLEVGRFKAGVRLFPLIFGGRVEVTHFVLENPSIFLEKSRDGSGNWEFEPAKKKSTTPQSGSESSEHASEAPGDITLNDVRLDGGTVIFVDRTQDTTTRIEEIGMSVSLTSLDDPLTFDGTLSYNGEKIAIDARIGNPRAFMNHQQSDISAEIDSGLIDLSFKGILAQLDAPGATLPLSGSGTAEIDIPSVRKLSAWAGAPMKEGEGFGPFMVKGDVTASRDHLAFEDADLRFDDMKGDGALDLRLDGPRPKIAGRLDMNKIDLTPYQAKTDGTKSASKPKNQSTNKAAGWSSEPMDFSALKSIDANFSMTAGAFLTNTVEMGRSTVDVTLANGILTLDAKEVALYDGKGVFRLTIDASRPATRVRSNFNLDIMQMQPFLRDLVGSGLLKGITTLEMEVTTSGRSQRDFASGLSGKGKIILSNGALFGVNLPRILRQPESALELVNINLLSADERTTNEQTDFAEFGLTFTIENGILKTDDLRLLNPLVRVLGAGLIDIGGQGLDLGLEPRAVSDLTGQGGTLDIAGLGLPIRVTGTWAKPKFGPDWCKISQRYGRSKGGDLGALAATLTQAASKCPGAAKPEQLLERGAQELFRLLDDRNKKKDGEDANAEETKNEEPSPQDGLLNFLRRK